MGTFTEWFWQDYFWLPKGVSFRDLEDKPGFTYAKPRDLFYVPLIGLGIYAIRLLYERYIALPMARYRSLPDGKNRKAPQSNKQLEQFFKEKKQPTEAEIQGLAKQLDWSASSVRRWFRRKRNINRPSLQTKFCEASWRCLFYTFAFIYGIYSLWQSPWLWDNLQCWVDYPRQSLEHSTYVYYVVEASFYMSLLFSVMGDVKRKDFREQLIHHVATLFLIGFSYVANFVRVGTLVMAVHDISDIFLEGAKCAIYSDYKWLADTLFVVFAVVFLVSRLVVFPFWILHTTMVKSMWLFEPYPGYYFFNALLLVLQLLHIFWSSLIIKMAFTMLTNGKVENDDRSDVEEASTDDEAVANDNHNSKTTNGPKNDVRNRK